MKSSRFILRQWCPPLWVQERSVLQWTAGMAIACSFAYVMGAPSGGSYATRTMAIDADEPSTAELDTTQGLSIASHPTLPERPSAEAFASCLEPESREQTLQWPVDALGVNSLYGARTHPVDGARRFHYGLDLEANWGDPVFATTSGVVREARWNGGHGRQIIVDHAGGLSVSYSHLSKFEVEPGAIVKAGQIIGRVGSTGRSTGPHLHVEITYLGHHIDPLLALGRRMEDLLI